MSLTIERYGGNESEWDKFMLDESMNGTFLQTRKFINYHAKGKFKDCSLCIRKGQELMAAVLACEVDDDGTKTFFAHKGTTFGGITISRKIYTASLIDELFTLLDDFLKSENFGKVYLKLVPVVFQRENTDMIDYFLYKYGYMCRGELNCYITLSNYGDDIALQFSTNNRRNYRYSLNKGLAFRELNEHKDISSFYEVLQKNLKKFNALSVHSLDELYDLKYNRFNDRIKFYGVYLGEKLVAGSMVFLFGNDIYHTQYLASDKDYLKLFPMDFLIANLILTAIHDNMRLLTLGICTEDQGRYLNFGLSRFKEGFGATFCVNRSYEKLQEISVEQPMTEPELIAKMRTANSEQRTALILFSKFTDINLSLMIYVIQGKYFFMLWGAGNVRKNF